MTGRCILSVDVEEWFHILDVPSTPPISAWDALPSTIEKNFRKLLELFARHQGQTTCFFLGWVANKYPHLVREASEQGHEIASHGFSHTLAYEMTAEEFYQDVKRSKEILEDISGKPVYGYRAPGFSVTNGTPWFFEALAKAGYSYDSSVFSGTRGHGGVRGARTTPHEIVTESGQRLIEFPVSMVKVISRNVCLFGGGYLRLFPWWLIRPSAKRLMKWGHPVIFYVHPREIDSDHPRLPMSRTRAFKSYVNLKTTQQKLERVLEQFHPISFQEFLKQHGNDVVTQTLPLTPAVKARHAHAGK